ncbi:hypothetical protein GGP69_001245 [Salinibacter ruber]|nr:hypothetical protein [Salinibacter ruber]
MCARRGQGVTAAPRQETHPLGQRLRRNHIRREIHSPHDREPARFGAPGPPSAAGQMLRHSGNPERPG